jgi:hypothetical protein
MVRACRDDAFGKCSYSILEEDVPESVRIDQEAMGLRKPIM